MLKKIILSILLAVGVVALGFGGYLFYLLSTAEDEELRDVSEWIITEPLIEESENGFYLLKSMPQTYSGDEKEMIAYLAGEDFEDPDLEGVLNLEYIENFLNEESDVLEKAYELINYRYFYNATQMADFSGDVDDFYYDSSLYLAQFNTARDMVVLDLLYKAHNQNLESLDENFSNLLAFVDGHAKSSHSFNYSLVSVMISSRDFYAPLNYLFENFEDDERVYEVAKTIVEYEFDYVELCETSDRLPIANFINMVDWVEQNSESWMENSNYHFKPNKTKNDYIAFRLKEKNFDQEYGSLPKPGSIKSYFYENYIGQIMVNSFTAARVCDPESLEKEHGQYLKDLQQLSQDYIDQYESLEQEEEEKLIKR